MENYDRSTHARQEAEKVNCDILASTPETLLLDLDSEAAHKTFMHNYPILCKYGLFRSYEMLRSRNGNRHCVVTLAAPRDLPFRLLLHCLLGSDLVRERLSLERVLVDDPMPSLLFRPRANATQTLNEEATPDKGKEHL
jgi:hypothetical protein